MKRAIGLSFGLLLAGLACFAQAQVPMTGAGKGTPTVASGCSQATTFLARTSLAGSDITNYTNLICGMVTDSLITGDLSTTGCGSLFDVLYIWATVNTATAQLNICSTSYSATLSNSPTFTAYSGYNSSSGGAPFITVTGADYSTLADFTQNSAHIDLWNLTNVAANDTCLGSVNAGAAGILAFYPKFGDNNMYFRVNDSSGGFAVTDPRGHVLGNRSSSTARQLYQNASTTLNGGTSATYGSTASSAPNGAPLLLTSNGGGSACQNVIAEASIGASLNSTQVTNLYNRLRTYMTAVGVP